MIEWVSRTLNRPCGSLLLRGTPETPTSGSLFSGLCLVRHAGSISQCAGATQVFRLSLKKTNDKTIHGKEVPLELLGETWLVQATFWPGSPQLLFLDGRFWGWAHVFLQPTEPPKLHFGRRWGAALSALPFGEHRNPMHSFKETVLTTKAGRVPENDEKSLGQTRSISADFFERCSKAGARFVSWTLVMASR